MRELSGFLSVPRLPEVMRKAGASFWLTVDKSIGPQRWLVRWEGGRLEVKAPQSLQVGQKLFVQFLPSEKNQLRLHWLNPPPPTREAQPALATSGALLSAFMAQGLPLASQRLGLLERWLQRLPPIKTKQDWAAALEAKDWPLAGPSAQALEAWLGWLSQLEQGKNAPWPETPDFWDLWNTRSSVGSGTWLICPLRWETARGEECGLLQAHWNTSSRAIDQWRVTAAPGAWPFRLEALCYPSRLKLLWTFFHQAHEQALRQYCLDWSSQLSDDQLAVELTFGRPEELECASTVLDRVRIDDYA